MTAPFVYARIMGTTDKQAKGYAKTALDRFSSLPKTSTPAEFGAFIAEQAMRWGEMVKLAGARIE